MMCRMRSISVLRNRSGAAVIEFALVLPLLILLFVAMLELSNFVVMQQRLKRAAHGLAGVITQGNSISRTQLNQLYNALGDMMWPYRNQVSVAISGVTRSSGPPPPCDPNGMRDRHCVAWQYIRGGLAAPNLGPPGSLAAVPSFDPRGWTIRSEQNYIVAEVWIRYEPLLAVTNTILSTVRARTLYAWAVYTPGFRELRN